MFRISSGASFEKKHLNKRKWEKLPVVSGVNFKRNRAQQGPPLEIDCAFFVEVCFNLPAEAVKSFVEEQPAFLIRIPQTEIFYGINKINEIFEEERIIMERGEEGMLMKVLEAAFVFKREEGNETRLLRL